VIYSENRPRGRTAPGPRPHGGAPADPGPCQPPSWGRSGAADPSRSRAAPRRWPRGAV